jgi:hypothetical protein
LLSRVNKAYALTSPELLFLLCSLPAIEGYAMQGEREEQQLTSSSTSLSSRASAASGELFLDVAVYRVPPEKSVASSQIPKSPTFPGGEFFLQHRANGVDTMLINSFLKYGRSGSIRSTETLIYPQ